MAEGIEKKTEEGGGAAPPRKSSRLLFTGISGAVMLINAAIAFALIQATRSPAPRAEETVADTAAQESRGKSIGAISDPPIKAIVNIAGTDGMRFLKVVVAFEYDDKKYKELGMELTRREAQFKDLLINKLSTLTIEELEGIRERNEIRRDLKRMVNQALPDETGEIREVYFNDFIIQ